jgi:hypothetical protein
VVPEGLADGDRPGREYGDKDGYGDRNDRASSHINLLPWVSGLITQEADVGCGTVLWHRPHLERITYAAKLRDEIKAMRRELDELQAGA